jgi:Tfp pilus assembly protein PilO
MKLYVKSKGDELTKYKDKYKKLKAEYSIKKKEVAKYARFHENHKNTSLRSLGQLIKDKSINRATGFSD